MNNNYLLTNISNSLGIFEPKNYIRYNFTYNNVTMNGNKLSFTAEKIKDNKQYLFNFFLENVEFESIKEVVDGYEITLFDDDNLKEFSDVGKIRMLDINNKEVNLYYNFINNTKNKIKINTNIKLKLINNLTYLDTCNHSGIYLVKDNNDIKYIESLNIFNSIYNFTIHNAPFVYYKTNEEDVIKEDKMDDRDPSIVFVYPTVTTIFDSNFDNNYSNSSVTYKNTTYKVVTAIKINDDSLEGASDLQYFMNNELPILIDSIKNIDTKILDVMGLRVVEGKPIFNNGLSIFYELIIEFSEVLKNITSPKLNDCLFYEIS